MPLGYLPGTPTGQVVAETTNGELLGYNFRETSGSAAATIKIYSGSSASATKLLATIGLPESASTDITYPLPPGAGFAGGLFAVTTGAVEGFVRWTQALGG